MDHIELHRQTIPSGLVPRDFLNDDLQEKVRKRKIHSIVTEARRNIPPAIMIKPSGLHEDHALHPDIIGTVVLPLQGKQKSPERGRNRSLPKAA